MPRQRRRVRRDASREKAPHSPDESVQFAEFATTFYARIREPAILTYRSAAESIRGIGELYRALRGEGSANKALRADLTIITRSSKIRTALSARYGAVTLVTVFLALRELKADKMRESFLSV